MRFKLPVNVTNQEADKGFVRFVAQTFGLINTILNGEVGFLDNCKTGYITVTFANANVQQAVAHGLGKPPNGYFVGGNKPGGTVYDGTSPQTAQYIYLQASVAGKYKVMIF